MKISIIIPTFNEPVTIGKLVAFLRLYMPDTEIVIVDGGSLDDTWEVLQSLPVRAVQSPHKGRGAQMNYGASVATGDWLYFLHADSFPPTHLLTHLAHATAAGYTCGCFRLRFDYPHWFLRLNAWFTRFDSDWVRFGDQSLFAERTLFEKAGGFREDWVIMEDQEIISRLKAHGKFLVGQDYVTTSARKYLDNGIFRLQVVFFLIWFQWKLGYTQPQLVQTYRRYIRRQDKV